MSKKTNRELSEIQPLRSGSVRRSSRGLYGTGIVCLAAAVVWSSSGERLAAAPAAGGASKAEIRAARGAAAAGTAPVYYYEGSRKVELHLALDELEVESQAPDRDVSKVKAAGVSSAAPGSARTVHVKTSASTGDVAGLKSEAARLKKATGARHVRAVLYTPTAERSVKQRQSLTDRIAVKVAPGESIARLAARYGLTVDKAVDYSPDTYILVPDAGGALSSLEIANTLFETEKVEFATPMLARLRSRRAEPADPLYGQQWHLKNTGAPQQVNAVAGYDVNAVPAWDAGLTGAGVNIGVTDDGLELTHPDLSGRVVAGQSIDINYGDTDPTPQPGDPGTGPEDSHGTACGGVASATRNAIGGVGAGYGAGLIGIRLISDLFTDEDEATAMLHKMNPANAANRIDINTNSWGPFDDGSRLEGPGPLAAAAFEQAINQGRGGLGTIFTWAGGNGRDNDDNVNADGYASSQHTIAVGAVYADGGLSYYSEGGSSLFITAPSSDEVGAGYYGIVTTDRVGSFGYSATDYTTLSGAGTFGGTSSACPLVAGCISLMLEANPNLTWRDVQHILAKSSREINPLSSAWQTNPAGYHFHHDYGFGLIDTAAAVELARTWTNVPARYNTYTVTKTQSQAIPDNNGTGITQTVNVSGVPVGYRMEHVQVKVNVTHTWRGDLAFTLTAPSGTVSYLLPPRPGDGSSNYSNWVMMSLPTWGENPNGTWTLKVADYAGEDAGTLTSWELKIHGHLQHQVDQDFRNTPTAWTVFGLPGAAGSATYDAGTSSLRVTVPQGATNRILGWRTSDAVAWIPYLAVGTENYVRGRFWLYADGQSGGNSNQIPNFRLRLSSRFAFSSILDVYHHSTADPEADPYSRDFRPTTSYHQPSLYRVDIDPVDVPYLTTNGHTEGISQAFEAYSLSSEPQENGYLGMTEASIGIYPKPASAALLKTYETTSDFAHSFYYSTIKLNRAMVNAGDLTNSYVAANLNGSATTAPNGSPLPLLSQEEVRTAVNLSNSVTLNTSAVGQNFIAIAAVDFLAGADEDTNLALRARVEKDKIYKIRFHATSTQQSSNNPIFRFRTRTAKFQWTQRLEVGGAWGAGTENNAIARQALPGIGCQNPDQLVPGEAGGWYTVLMHTPLSKDIRADFPSNTFLTVSMPNFANQPAPGVNAASRRDIFPGIDVIDTLSAGTNHNLERGHLRVDKIEIRSFDFVGD